MRGRIGAAFLHGTSVCLVSSPIFPDLLHWLSAQYSFVGATPWVFVPLFLHPYLGFPTKSLHTLTFELLELSLGVLSFRLLVGFRVPRYDSFVRTVSTSREDPTCTGSPDELVVLDQFRRAESPGKLFVLYGTDWLSKCSSAAVFELSSSSSKSLWTHPLGR